MPAANLTNIGGLGQQGSSGKGGKGDALTGPATSGLESDVTANTKQAMGSTGLATGNVQSHQAFMCHCDQNQGMASSLGKYIQSTLCTLMLLPCLTRRR